MEEKGIHIMCRRASFHFVLFAAVTVLSFTIAAPQAALSASRTFHSRIACPDPYATGVGDTKIWNCGFVSDTALPAATLSAAYFDFGVTKANYVTVQIERESYTGSFSADSGSTYASIGSHDFAVTPVNVKVNSSQWDYLGAQVAYASSLTGITLIY